MTAPAASLTTAWGLDDATPSRSNASVAQAPAALGLGGMRGRMPPVANERSSKNLSAPAPASIFAVIAATLSRIAAPEGA